jgi:2Fe-2S ferredoxin
MPRFTLETRDGERREVTGKDGATLLKVIRKSGVEELTARCGGGCACATCHVYITHPEGVALPDVGIGESRMLNVNPHRTLTSRLSCQVKLESGLEGMHVVIAPEDLSEI